MTNTLLDLYTSPQSADFVAGLREECERVYKAHDNKWTKNAVNELHRVDSTLKESMRLSGIGFQALLRKVVQKDGVNIGNTHIPGNTIVAVPSGAIHRDPEYDPSIFSNRPFTDHVLLQDSMQRLIRSMHSASLALERHWIAMATSSTRRARILLRQMM